jgi:hypothetical protein
VVANLKAPRTHMHESSLQPLLEPDDNMRTVRLKFAEAHIGMRRRARMG